MREVMCEIKRAGEGEVACCQHGPTHDYCPRSRADDLIYTSSMFTTQDWYLNYYMYNESSSTISATAP